ncbi:MAG TPA: hypothetical protein VLT47_01230 [Anaeromyxobacteraceae bacterium]|nr:hypothetical protein [Anaeromyxobacteraceae bacterium]
MRRSAPLFAAAVMAGCAPALRAVAPAGVPSPGDAEAAAAEVHALARQAEAETSASRRARLSEQAVAAGQRCERAAPGSPPCEYALAIALGLQARERPTTVREGLAQMVARLRRASAADPALDHAGPDRVLALLLLRAPGWPLGPGDPEEGLAAARRAVALSPGYAPNQLALAEALRANGDAAGAREAVQRALTLAEAAYAAGEADGAGWLREARRLADAP